MLYIVKLLCRIAIKPYNSIVDFVSRAKIFIQRLMHLDVLPRALVYARRVLELIQWRIFSYKARKLC